MKKSKSIPVQQSCFSKLGQKPCISASTLILWVGAGFMLGAGVTVGILGKAYASFPNRVAVSTVPHAEVKAQFLPLSDELPVLYKNVGKEEYSSGAQYEEGEEVFVEPDSAALTVSDTAIIEKEDLDGPPTPEPSPLPSSPLN